VVCGTLRASAQVLAGWGWTINPACVDRLHLDLRQWGAAIGRRGTPLCQGEDGLRHPLALCPADHHVVRPHTSLRPPWRVSETTPGRGSAQVWGPCTLARAAGWTEPVGTLQAVLRCRVPPWPPPHAVERVGEDEEREAGPDGWACARSPGVPEAPKNRIRRLMPG
jgi:hypothetical protein